MIVKARYKDEEPENWFDVELTDDQRMIDVATKTEITRTDLLFKGDGDEIIDMDEEWADYRHEMMLADFHEQARYLARQHEYYNEKYAE